MGKNEAVSNEARQQGSVKASCKWQSGLPSSHRTYSPKNLFSAAANACLSLHFDWADNMEMD